MSVCNLGDEGSIDASPETTVQTFVSRSQLWNRLLSGGLIMLEDGERIEA
eukprot:COSAG02_NODE_2029_length_10068_cov_19.817936_5_plen_50_part_00